MCVCVAYVEVLCPSASEAKTRGRSAVSCMMFDWNNLRVDRDLKIVLDVSSLLDKH